MKSAVEKTWNEFADRLGQFIRGRVADSSTAQDILHDVFLKFQHRFEELNDPAKVQGWLFLVARNAIIDYFRTRKQSAEISESLPAQPPEETTEIEELRGIFHRIINELPERYRQALLLTEFDGLTQEQLAKRLRISLPAAKSRVLRGRERLKEKLLDYYHRELRRFDGEQLCPKGLLPSLPISEKSTAPQSKRSAK
jgi:RNA polymerase sigma-70 factor, ECF subfamily